MRAVRGQAVRVAAIELVERRRLAGGEAAAKELVGESLEEQRAHVWSYASLSCSGFEELLVVVVATATATATAVVTVTVVAAVNVVGLLLVLVARERRQRQQAVRALGELRQDLVPVRESGQVEAGRDVEDEGHVLGDDRDLAGAERQPALDRAAGVVGVDRRHVVLVECLVVVIHVDGDDDRVADVDVVVVLLGPPVPPGAA